MEQPNLSATVDEKAITLEEMIRCANREVEYRRRVYARLLDAGKMRKEKADYEIACMRAIVAKLEELRR
jgi:hypothetical protein